MQYTKLWERVTWPLGFTMLTYFPGIYLPHSGIRVFVLCLATFSVFWAIQRVWSYQPSTEIEKRVQLMKLKLGYTLLFAGLTSLIMYTIIGQFIEANITLTLDWLYLPGVGILAAIIGIILLIQGRKLKPESA